MHSHIGRPVRPRFRHLALLAAETGEEEIGRPWQAATALHQNFYENWLPKEMVADNIEDVKELVRKLGS